MGKLEGKTALIFGVANDHSIAWGIAQAFHREGARIGFSYAMPSLEKRVRPLAESLGSDFIELCDVTDDSQLDAIFAKAKEHFGTIDILVHAVAFANREDLMGRFVDTTREGFLLAHNISVYSFVAMAARARELMPNGGSMMTLTYYGSQKVAPKYNVMGVAKAALEASVRYLAVDFGGRNIRVNAISAGPIRTLAGAGIADARQMFNFQKRHAPLKRTVTIEEVGGAALYLLSGLSSGVTGEVHFVDSGYNIISMPQPDALKTVDEAETAAEQRAEAKT